MLGRPSEAQAGAVTQRLGPSVFRRLGLESRHVGHPVPPGPAKVPGAGGHGESTVCSSDRPCRRPKSAVLSSIADGAAHNQLELSQRTLFVTPI